MALDSRYVLINNIQGIFIDVDNAEVLAGGKIYFYKDSARTTLKKIYKLSGSPPDYTYVELPNPLTLSANGTFVDDDGVETGVYLFPYDENGAIDLYYMRVMKVVSGVEVEQWNRGGLPNVTEGTNTGSNINNLVLNPQFLLHNDLTYTDGITATGTIKSAVTQVAPGGWVFERPSGSTATDIVTFDRIGSYVVNPSASPRYKCRIRCTVPNAGDTYKRCSLKFRDVNKFASDSLTCTFALSGVSNSGSTLTAAVVLIKNYGTGGSTQEITTLGTIIFTPNEQMFNFNFVVGNNTGKTIGPNNDDYMAIGITFNTAITHDISFTDVIYVTEAATFHSFPITTDERMVDETTMGSLPIPPGDRSKLGLKAILGLNGWQFDDAEVGCYFPCDQNGDGGSDPGFGYLLCDGANYEYAALDPDDGIPYKRLGDKYWMPAWNFYRHSTGINYCRANAFVTTPPTITLAMNNFGQPTAASDGSIPTGFTFRNVNVGSAATNNFYCISTSYYCVIRNNLIGTTSLVNSAGTTGFIVDVPQAGNTLIPQIVAINTTGVIPAAGSYLQVCNTTTQFVPWFEVNGLGAEPGVSGTKIKISITSDYDANDIAYAINNALNGQYMVDILTVAGSAIAPGSWWQFYTPDLRHFVPWYKKDGIGTAPVITGAILIEVDISNTSTAAQVATLTMIAINRKYFAVPDPRGMFLRVRDNGAGWDPEAGGRWFYNNVQGMYGDMTGTQQYDQLLQHTHISSGSGDHIYKIPVWTNGTNGSVQAGSQFYYPEGVLLPTGSYESRPVNFSVDLKVKY